MAQRFTKEELLQDIDSGINTVADLAAKYGLSTSSMKSALNKLDIVLDGEVAPQPIKMINFSSASEDAKWKQLYKDYEDFDRDGNPTFYMTQAQFIIAECKVANGMTADEARAYMKDNFKFTSVSFKPTQKEKDNSLISKYNLA